MHVFSYVKCTNLVSLCFNFSIGPTISFFEFFFRQQTTEISKLLWKSIFFLYVQYVCLRVLLYGASKTGNPLPVWGEILQTILEKSAQDLLRIKTLFSPSLCEHHFQSSHYSIFQLINIAPGTIYKSACTSSRKSANPFV